MGRKRLSERGAQKYLENLLKGRYQKIFRNVIIDDGEIDLLGVIDDNFCDLIEIKSSVKETYKHKAYWQLMNANFSLDGKDYFVKNAFYYGPDGLRMLKGSDFVKVWYNKSEDKFERWRYVR